MSVTKAKAKRSQGHSANKEAPGTALPALPPFGKELGSQISAVLDLYDDRKSAVAIAGKSADMLRAYAKGENQPPFDVVARLASQKGVSLEWLASGQWKFFNRRLFTVDKALCSSRATMCVPVRAPAKWSSESPSPILSLSERIGCAHV